MFAPFAFSLPRTRFRRIAFLFGSSEPGWKRLARSCSPSAFSRIEVFAPFAFLLPRTGTRVARSFDSHGPGCSSLAISRLRLDPLRTEPLGALAVIRAGHLLRRNPQLSKSGWLRPVAAYPDFHLAPLAVPDLVSRVPAFATSPILAAPAPVSRILAFSIAVFLATPEPVSRTPVLSIALFRAASRFSHPRTFDCTLSRRAFSYSHAESRPSHARQHKLFIRRVVVAMAQLARRRAAWDD